MARLIRDCRGETVRLTDERVQHVISQHPEVASLGGQAIGDALMQPDAIIVSASGDRLYYRYYRGTEVGDKFICVVVKSIEEFVVTAYMTDRQKKGVRVWPVTT